MEISRSHLWLHRIIGAISLVLAFICLYLALSLFGEKLFTERLTEKLNAKGIESHWNEVKWSGDGICATLVRIDIPHHSTTLEAESFCATLSFRSKWPYIGIDDLELNKANIWFSRRAIEKPLITRSRLTLKTKDADKLSTASSMIKRRVDWGQAKLDKLIHVGGLLQSSLSSLKEHQLSIVDSKLLVHRSLISLGEPYQRLSIKIDGKFNATGGHLKVFNSALVRPVQIELGPEELRTRSEISLHTSDEVWSISEGASISFGRDLKIKAALNAGRSARQIEAEIIYKPIADTREESEIKVLLQKPSALGSDHHRSTSKGHLSQLEFLLTLSSRDFRSLDVKAKHLASKDLILLLSKTIREPKKLYDIQALITSAISGQLSLNKTQLRYQVELTDPVVRMIGLPEMTWPLITLRGELPFEELESQERTKWSIPALELGIINRSQPPVIFKLTTELELGSTAVVEHPLGKVSRLSFDLETRRVSCQSLFEVIPKQLLGPVKGANVKGIIGPTVSFNYHSPTKARQQNSDEETPLASLKASNYKRKCRFDSLSLDLNPRPRVTKRGRKLKLQDVTWLNEPFSFTIDPQYTNGAKIIVGPEQESYVSYNKLPSYVGGAMYLTEETGFWRGGAFSASLLARAINTNLREGSFVYGGSTITQQLVKNLFLHREKTIERKVQEAIISARVVDEISKQRVLELYLNMIEFGPSVYGIQAAAQYYFQKDAQTLSPEEAVFLAMLKVSPKRGEKWKRRGSSPTFTWWRSRMVQIFDRLVKEGLLSERRAKGAAPFVLKWSDGQYIGTERL